MTQHKNIIMKNPAIIAQNEQEPVKEELSLSEWIFQRIRPFVGGRVLEVDNGDGRIAPFCKQLGIQTDALPLNMTHIDFDKEYNGLSGAYNMVIALHIVHDANLRRQVFANCFNLLKKEGFLVIQLPIYTALYEGLDDGFGEWRWNNRLFMTNQLQANYNIIKIGYCMVTDTINYRERVNVFNSVLASGFDQEGLSAIVVGQKL